MDKLILFTGNQRKIAEAKVAFDEYDIAFEAFSADIDEIQHHDPTEIAKAKARAAYDAIKKPVVVADTSWAIPALGGFPGGYMKDVSAWLQAEDWISIMANHEDRTIYCHEHVAYFDGEELQHFTTSYKGTIVNEPRGRIDDSESIERVTILYGDKTMAEQVVAGDIASAGEVLGHWQQFGEWYANNR